MKRSLLYYTFVISAVALVNACMVDEDELTGQKSSINEEVAGEMISVSASMPSSFTKGSGGIIYDVQNLLDSGDSASLYSYATFTGNINPNVAVLDNVPMWYSGSSWTYTPPQYWLPSADKYEFFLAYPYLQNRLSPNFVFPNSTDYKVLEYQTRVYPMYESWGGQDYAQGNVIQKRTLDLYFSNHSEDIMFGQTEVYPSNYGKTVSVPMKHAMAAVRFSVKNLSESAFVLTNWYMTGLKNHSDMAIYIIGCDEQYEPFRFMTVIPDKYIDDIKITSFEEFGEDSVKFTADSPYHTAADYIICADGGVDPGHNGYYEYVMLSSPLKETGNSKGLTHEHNADGTILYKVNSLEFNSLEELRANESYQGILTEIKKAYYDTASTSANKVYTFPNYSKFIFWGPEHGLCTDNFFMPLVYKYGAQIIDFNGNQVRGDDGDYDLNIHQYECSSHIFETSANSGTYRANGGIYMPVSSEYEAYLYSPYFMNAGTFSFWQEDWKEGTVKTVNDSLKVDVLDKNSSSFRVVYDDSHPYDPCKVDTCCANFNALNGEFAQGLLGSNLGGVLNDYGYILMYPQTLEKLVYNFYTCNVSENSGSLSYSPDNVLHTFNPADYTPGGEWRSGYTYDYKITVSSAKISVQLDVQPWNDREIELD